MTDFIGAAIAEAAAQPQAETTIEATKETTTEATADQNPAADETPEDPWPKKAINALSEQKGKAAKWRNTAKQYEAEIARLTSLQKPAQETAQANTQGGNLSPAKTGIPTKLDMNNFANWADYSEARAEEIADYRIDQKLTERDSKQKETQATEKEIAWENERASAVDKMGEEFAKDTPEIIQIFNENAEIIKSYPKEIKHALLAADNPPLALFNLHKAGKLEDLGDMSIVDAKVEIRLAQQTPVTKPKTKAPTPLPASRGSVPAGKELKDFSPREALNFLTPKD